ncbi:MAG TPA: hypothetical protein PLN41_02380 [Methanothrix sp.]|nr:hypothetical protein [Methanothrix sp.]
MKGRLAIGIRSPSAAIADKSVEREEAAMMGGDHAAGSSGRRVSNAEKFASRRGGVLEG